MDEKFIREADGSRTDVSDLEAPWYVVGLQVAALGPVALLCGIASALEAAAKAIEWAVKGRAWASIFGRAATSIEIAWYRRQLRKRHQQHKRGRR